MDIPSSKFKVHELGKSKELFVNSSVQSGKRIEGSLLKFADRPKIFHMLKEKKVGPPPPPPGPSGPLPFKFTGSFLLLLLLKVGRQ